VTEPSACSYILGGKPLGGDIAQSGKGPPYSRGFAWNGAYPCVRFGVEVGAILLHV